MLAAPSVGARRLALVKGVVPVSLLIDQKPIVVSDDIEKAKYYPEDDEFLLEFEPRVVHYEVVGKS